MTNSLRAALLLFAVAGLLFSSGRPASALREIGGKEPVKDAPWPEGCLAVANLASRLAYSCGYDHQFVYRGDTETFQKALDAFGAIRAPVLELRLHDGPLTISWAKGFAENKKEDDGRVDWTFSIWNPEQWHALHNTPEAWMRRGHQPVPAPRLDVYVTVPATTGGIEWARVKMPANIRVIDERGEAERPKAMTVRGTVYDMASGKTISGAKLEAQKWADQKKTVVATAKADEAGRFELSNVPTEYTQILVSAKGYATRAVDQAWYRSNERPIPPLVIELCTEVTVKGSVCDEQGQPLSGIRVHMSEVLGLDGGHYYLPETPEIRTDEAGRFTFAGAPSGFALFGCSGDGWVMLHRETPWKLKSWLALKGDDVVPTGEVPVSLVMAKPATLRCVVSSTDGKPLKGEWNVSIAGAEGGYSSEGRARGGNFSRSASVQADGRAEFTDIPAGRYYVIDGYRIDMTPNPKIVTVRSGETVEVKLSVQPRPERKVEEAPAVVPPKPPKKEVEGDF